VHLIPQKKRSPLFLGNELDDRVKSYIKGVRTTLALQLLASGEAIVRRIDKK